MRLLPLILSVILLSAGCRKEDPPKPEPEQPKEGALTVEFDNRVGNDPLELQKDYINPNGDSIRIAKFNYYVSNFVLTADDNSTFQVPESYFLVKHPAQRAFTLRNIPPKKYKSVSFIIGVDSTRNVSGAQTGGLDVAYASGMFWTWNSGYIFLLIEGKSPQSGSGASQSLTYHIGGYGGVNKAQRGFTIPFSTSVDIREGLSPRVILNTDLLEFFRTPNLIDVKTQYFMKSAGPGAKVYADNYADMITFGSISQ